jgi:PAS domain S-box-containing protein
VSAATLRARRIRGWVWLLLWFAASAVVAAYSSAAHRKFRAALTETFNQQQALSVQLIERLLVDHVQEAEQNLAHVADLIRATPAAGTGLASAPASVLRSHPDQFKAIQVVSAGGRVRYDSRGPGQKSLFSVTSFEEIDPTTAEAPFLSERVMSPRGEPRTYLFHPFQLPDGSRHFAVGELDVKAFLASELRDVVGREIGVLVADYLGDVYLIKNTDHERIARMERGNIFSLGDECRGCHQADSFDDVRRSVREDLVVHDIYRTARGRYLNRTSAPVKILNEEWVVSTSIPYEKVQGQINANARDTFASAAVLLLFMGAGAYVYYELQKRTVLEAQYYTIVDTIRVGLCRMTAQGQIVGANPALAEMLGLPRGELIGQDLGSFAPDRAAFEEFFGALRTRGAALDRELELRRRDGSAFLASFSGIASPHEAPETGPFDVVVQDITDRKRAEQQVLLAKEQLEHQNEELQKLDRMKDALLRDVAHELKTPVAKHAMQLEILRPMLQAHRVEERELRAFQVMEESIRRQQSVVRNLLNLARLEAGGREYRLEPTPLDEVLRRVQADYQYALDTYGISFELAVPAVTIRTDGEMLWHVFSNLVNNAIKFRRKEGAPRIRVVGELAGDRVAVRVEDNGIGLSPEQRGKIFSSFYQATASTEGSGVGLSICKKIVEDLGGSIRLESPGLGEGSTVTVELPAA